MGCIFSKYFLKKCYDGIGYEHVHSSGQQTSLWLEEHPFCGLIKIGSKIKHNQIFQAKPKMLLRHQRPIQVLRSCFIESWKHLSKKIWFGKLTIVKLVPLISDPLKHLFVSYIFVRRIESEPYWQNFLLQGVIHSKYILQKPNVFTPSLAQSILNTILK